MYYGPWVFARKPEETSERADKDMPPVTLIHDNESARALGFKGGFVGGLDLLSIAESAIDAAIGHIWYEGGHPQRAQPGARLRVLCSGLLGRDQAPSGRVAPHKFPPR